MIVWVMFDPLYERVVCVHEEPGMRCKDCEHIAHNFGYGIREEDFEVKPGKRANRDLKLDDLGIDDGNAI